MMMPSWTTPAAPGTQPPVPYSYPPNPAYTTVQVRTSFDPQPQLQYQHAGGHLYPSHGYPVSQVPAAPIMTAPYEVPPANSIAAPQEPSKRKMEWPESVREYVRRSFLPSNLDASVSRAEMEAKLKEIISVATDKDMVYRIDWNGMPLPQVLIRQQRAKTLIPSASEDASRLPRSESRPKELMSRKRKSTEQVGDDDTATPPWRSTNTSRASLEDRVTYGPVEKRQQVEEPPLKSSKLQKQTDKRQRRFDGGYKSAYRSPTPEPAPGPVVGTCEELEKRYLRLTAAPIPSKVRPERVLRQTLDLLRKKWKTESNYSYVCDQFKSMRQDLTVQHIRNEFTVSVYENHARIALEKGDLGEYNQCQTQLRALYALGLKGNDIEFKAYRILYFIHTANRTALNDAMADLTTAEKEEPPIKHALQVRSAVALGNYHKLFRLYLDTPLMGAYLMDMFVARERLAALCKICKIYKPDVRLRLIAEELGFESDADAAQFIFDNDGQHLLQERDGQIFFLTGKAGSVFEVGKAAAFSRVDIKGQI